MGKLRFFNFKNIEKLLSKRAGEVKMGEKLQFIDKIEDLKASKADFVLFGVPEDIGPRANYGKAGASTAWEACLSALVNVQDNYFFNSKKLLLLGEIDCSEEMQKASNFETSDPNYFIKMGELVEKIDEAVSETVKAIISAGKTPIIIGGGHNNAYGNIKGASEAFSKPINALNIDAHTDLRQLEHRHSGNGFSYARKNGFLRKYAVFGLHQNYTPEYIFEEMDASDKMDYTLLEEMLHFSNSEKRTAFKKSLDFLKSEKFGLEVDCDVMANFPSSAVSPSGFTLNEVRDFVKTAGKEPNCCYLHICEAATAENFPTGKALSYLITDFLKAKK